MSIKTNKTKAGKAAALLLCVGLMLCACLGLGLGLGAKPQGLTAFAAETVTYEREFKIGGENGAYTLKNAGGTDVDAESYATEALLMTALNTAITAGDDIHITFDGTEAEPVAAANGNGFAFLSAGKACSFYLDGYVTRTNSTGNTDSTIRLNGESIFYIIGGTFKNSQNGYVLYASENSLLIVNGGSIVASGGSVIACGGAGSLTVNDGVLSGSTYLFNVTSAAGNITINGGTLTGIVLLNGYSKTFTVNGGIIQSQSGNTFSIGNSSATVNIAGGTVSTGGGTAIHSSSSTGTVNISGGTVSAGGGIAIHNSSTGTVNISGGMVSAGGDYAIYNSSTGKITVSQAAGKTTLITSENVTATEGTIRASSGTVEINGGTVENTATTGLRYLIFKTSSATVKINGTTVTGTVSASVTMPGGGLTYNKNPQTPDSASFTIPGLTKDMNYTEGYADNVGAGNARFNAVIIGDGTDTTDVTLSVRFTIAKAAPAAPAAPTVSGTPTDTSITLTTISDAEYSKDNAATWQESPTFTGLTANTEYIFVARIKETVNNLVSASGAETKIKTAPSAPDAPMVSGTPTATSITLTTITGAEYSKDNGATWQDNPVFTELTANTEYTFVARIKASTNAYASASSAGTKIKTDKSTPSTPAAPVLSGTLGKNSVTVETIAGAEYSIDNGATWQDSPTFEGLKPNTEYTVLARFKATDNAHASAVSAALTFKTAKGGLSGGAIACIVIGSVLVTALAGFAILWFVIKKKTFAELIAAINNLFGRIKNCFAELFKKSSITPEEIITSETSAEPDKSEMPEQTEEPQTEAEPQES